MSKKQIATNKRAFHDYTIEEKLEVGIVLIGCEVKSLRQNAVTLRDSYVRIDNGELLFVGCYIPHYAQGNIHNAETSRDRRLLAHKRQIEKLDTKVKQKGYTIVPLKLYFSDNHVKLEIGLGRSKKLHDKRSDLKEKQLKRELDRSSKRGY